MGCKQSKVDILETVEPQPVQTEAQALNPPKTKLLSLPKAIKDGNLEIVKTHIQNGSDINQRLMWDNTPLILAAQYQQEDICLFLVESGADTKLVNEKGCSALLHAALEGLEKFVDELIKIDENVDYEAAQVYSSKLDQNVTVTPLEAASINGNINIFTNILNHIDKPLQPINPNSPLLFACRFGYSKIAELLLDKIDINIVDKEENTPLMLACKGKYNEIIDMLLGYSNENEIDIVNEINNNKQSPLMFACQSNLYDVVVKIIDLCTNINQQDCNGLTALMYCIKNSDYSDENMKIIHLLCSRDDIDMNIVDNNGMKVEDYPQYKQYLENKKNLDSEDVRDAENTQE